MISGWHKNGCLHSTTQSISSKHLKPESSQPGNRGPVYILHFLSLMLGVGVPGWMHFSPCFILCSNNMSPEMNPRRFITKVCYALSFRHRLAYHTLFILWQSPLWSKWDTYVILWSTCNTEQSAEEVFSIAPLNSLSQTLFRQTPLLYNVCRVLPCQRVETTGEGLIFIMFHCGVKRSPGLNWWSDFILSVMGGAQKQD